MSIFCQVDVELVGAHDCVGGLLASVRQFCQGAPKVEKYFFYYYFFQIMVKIFVGGGLGGPHPTLTMPAFVPDHISMPTWAYVCTFPPINSTDAGPMEIFRKFEGLKCP